MRVRHITQDDAHIFCTEDQSRTRSRRCLDFGFVDLRRASASSRGSSCRPGPRSGSARDEMWDTRRGGAASGARRARPGVRRSTPGDGAFYGPKIDLHMTDSIGRSWQLGTVQLDYSMPERFDLAYTGADNAEHRPVMIHRALLGSIERFIGILIEHYAGEFPLWLAPVQALVLPIADRHVDYARAGRRASCARPGLRVEVDDRARVGRAQDPRRRAAQGALHARRRRQGGRGRRRWRCAATARATSAR